MSHLLELADNGNDVAPEHARRREIILARHQDPLEKHAPAVNGDVLARQAGPSELDAVPLPVQDICRELDVVHVGVSEQLQHLIDSSYYD